MCCSSLQDTEIVKTGIEYLSTKIDYLTQNAITHTLRTFTIEQIAKEMTGGDERKTRKFLNENGAQIDVKLKNPSEKVNQKVLTSILGRKLAKTLMSDNPIGTTQCVLEYDITKWNPSAFGSDPKWRALWDLIWEETKADPGRS